MSLIILNLPGTSHIGPFTSVSGHFSPGSNPNRGRSVFVQTGDDRCSVRDYVFHRSVLVSAKETSLCLLDLNHLRNAMVCEGNKGVPKCR